MANPSRRALGDLCSVVYFTLMMPQHLPPLTPGRRTLDEQARATIKRWMHGTGATQAVLAARLRKTPGWVSRYLLGDFNADLETLRAIADAFGHPFMALFEEPIAPLGTPVDPLEARLVSEWRALPLDAREKVVEMVGMWARPYRSRPGPKR